ncbi:MAG: histidine kinase [Saprospiraceae bacterium]|nr:histidine kinase [Saprospiraceae bacterium]
MKTRIHVFLPIALSITLPVLSLFNPSGKPTVDSFGIFQGWISASIFLYALWYALMRTWKKMKGPIFLWPGAIMVIFFLIQFMTYHVLSDSPLTELAKMATFRTIVPSILFLSIQFALYAQLNITQLLLEKEQLQTENYRVKLMALRAQIDPHFLFNSMNTLRSLIRQKNDKAEQFVMSLADFYRHTLKHDDSTTLPLSEELQVLESYLFLMKSRNENAVLLDIKIHPSFSAYHLPILALQVLAENCFKHNSMTAKHPLCITLYTDTEPYIVIQNNIQPKLDPMPSSGLGLELIRKRYELLNIKDGILVASTQDQFIVKLKLIAP